MQKRGKVEKIDNTLSKRRRDAQLARWKRNAASPEYAEEANKILAAVGKVNRLRYLEMMLDMEAKYTGRGWKQCADDLEKYYFNNGLELRGIAVQVSF